MSLLIHPLFEKWNIPGMKICVASHGKVFRLYPKSTERKGKNYCTTERCVRPRSDFSASARNAAGRREFNQSAQQGGSCTY